MPSRKRALSSSLSAVPSSADELDDVKPSLSLKTRSSPKTTPVNGTSTSTPKRKSGSSRSATKVKKEELDHENDTPMVADEPAPAVTPSTPKRGSRKRTKDSSKKENKVDEGLAEEQGEEKPKPTPTPSKSTLTKKLKQLEAYLQTPYPEHTSPTPEQCQQVQDALAKIHGLPRRPEKLVDRAGSAAGCGAVPDVLDALIRTILSQNTTSKSPFFNI